MHLAGTAWIERLMPPVVTGAIVAAIGLTSRPHGSKTRSPVGAILMDLVAVMICGSVAAVLFFRP